MRTAVAGTILAIVVFGASTVVAPTGIWSIKRSETDAVPSRDAELFFVGDIMLSRAVGKGMEREKDYAYPFRLVRDELVSADILFGNLESPISNQGSNVGSIYSFRADPRSVEGLIFAGFDVLSFANNHVGDYGPVALLDTLDHLSRAGLQTVGAGRTQYDAHTPHIVEVNGLHIAFLAYTNIAPAYYLELDAEPAVANIVIDEIAQDIAQSKNVYNADLVVVSYHWGEEYQTHRNEWQADIAHQTVDAGALLVIGHHPHVVQEVEMYNGGVIAYSLGNFVFDQNFSPDTQKGLALRVNVREGKIEDAEELSVAFTSTYQPYFKTATSTNY
ncbi:MAG: hypothetical protein A2591_02980 [Candidatus Yonathbacteria bacterium RIFOXYD1_FULL_52_36]|uniref:Capsule synthesis protein CapA domain-containing protein n=1 Tax=Candidatus Yonathbacteria bacterium RIFOXYD1_FULL_52_36 TaxID=1802730 RepID=A0A1G2SL38_9BACT|nr:MAG: hypothetical protein A2591_02980 [Candidatus Yonathbacteria bacterium RIFOXYD1_FULL_52_36]